MVILLVIVVDVAVLAAAWRERRALNVRYIYHILSIRPAHTVHAETRRNMYTCNMTDLSGLGKHKQIDH